MGVISKMELTCTDKGESQNPYGVTVQGDGVYSDHTADFGTRNAFFIEDSTLVGCSHSVSSFCDGFIVFRHNTVRKADSHTDLHGPGYNYCHYNPDEKTAGGGMELYDNQFVESQGNWVINARAGQGHIYTRNRFDSDDYRILLYWDSGANRNGNNCGTDPGETCGRCYTIGCQGCCQAQEKTYIWDNDGQVIEYSGSADDCLIENTTYFLRAPTVAQDGFDWTPFTHPHPLTAGSPSADAGIGGDAGVDGAAGADGGKGSDSAAAADAADKMDAAVGADGGVGEDPSDGCGCSTRGASNAGAWLLLCLFALFVGRQRR
jgi:MYXO-CTERM domain-containing protein